MTGSHNGWQTNPCVISHTRSLRLGGSAHTGVSAAPGQSHSPLHCWCRAQSILVWERMNDWMLLTPLGHTAESSSPKIRPQSPGFRGQMWTAQESCALDVLGSDGQERLEASVPCHQCHVHLSADLGQSSTLDHGERSLGAIAVQTEPPGVSACGLWVSSELGS